MQYDSAPDQMDQSTPVWLIRSGYPHEVDQNGKPPKQPRDQNLSQVVYDLTSLGDGAVDLERNGKG